MTYLSDHLTVEEVSGASSWPMSAQAAANIPALAGQFEEIRLAGGDIPITLHSFYRNAVKNVFVGGASNSDHLTGQAWDGTPDKAQTDIVTWAQRVIAARLQGQISGWGQLILYPYSDGHVHVSFRGARGKVDQIYVEVAKSGANRYAPWDGVSPLPAWQGAGAGGLPSDAGLPTDEGAGSKVSAAGVAGVIVLVWLFWEVFGGDE